MNSVRDRSWSILLRSLAGTSRSALILASGLLLLASSTAHAIVDTNDNGLSDLWEKQYNSGNHFPITFDSLADPDGDGWTNAQEAAAGTDPFDANPPTGYVHPSITHIPAVYTTDANGNLEIVTPEAVTITWPTLVGKQYTLLSSVDLTAGSWIPIGDPEPGTGGEIGTGVSLDQSETASSPRLFLKIAITDFDNDGDHLTDYEEHLLETDPNHFDSDGDGLPDGWEAAEGLDPNDDGSLDSDHGANGDPDGDGIPNATDSTPFQMDDYVAVLESISIYMFSDQGGHYRSESSDTRKVSIDRLFLRYPDSELTAPVAHIHTIESGAFGSMTKVSITINATASSTESRKIKIMKVLDFYEANRPAEFQDPMIFVIPAGSTESQTIKVDPGVEDLDGETPDPDLQQAVSAIPITIKPVRGMAGVIGDVIRSVNTESDIQHFVTPQETSELSQDYVILEATGIIKEHLTPDHQNQLFEWDGGEEVPGDLLKRRVKRDLAGGPTIVKLKATDGEMVAAEMHVWVVWADVTVTQGSASFKSFLGGSIYGVPDEAATGWRFIFKIKPESILDQSNLERPSLAGSNRKPPPGNGNTYTIRPAWGEADSANFKWDLSRQYQLTIRNSGLIPKADLEQGNVAAAWIVNQPVSVDRPISFPMGGASPDVEGNDDPSASFLTDEDRNPYAARTDNPKLNHQIGELSSFDAPSLRVLDGWGAAGRSYAVEYNFNEFARVELTDGKRNSGQFWFRISDHIKWYHYLNSTYDSETSQWKDSTVSRSSSGTGHPKP
ncbi:MAG: hypothetical protein ACRCXD_15775 [Luteolibacter sp.]